MNRLVVFSIFLLGITCNYSPFYVAIITPEKDKPVILPPDAGTFVVFDKINGTLTPDSLAQLNVTRLELKVSNADELEPGAACSPPSLKSLDFVVRSRSLTVTKAMLKNCEKLETLSIGVNYHFRYQSIAIDALTPLHNLRDLSLYFLNLHNVTQEYFRNLSSLESLTLYDCLVEEVERDAFSGLTNLKNVHMISDSQSLNIFSETSLKVQKFTFKIRNGSLTKSKLDVTEIRFDVHYQLDAIEAGAICPTSSVRKVTLEFSSINSIQFTKETLQNCGNVEDLWIKADHSHLSEAAVDTFQNLANLKNFSLENVKIRHVTKNTLKNSLLLENLRLCNGHVYEVDSDAFNHLQHLKTVEICLHWDYDNLENAQKLFTNTLKADKLTFKELSGKLSQPQFKEIKELSLDFVSLKEIESGVCSSLTLKNFSLKFTPSDNFKLRNDSFNCENLEELILTAASLYPTYVPEEAFQHLSHLKVLSLSGLNFIPLKREYFKNLQSLEKLVFGACYISDVQSDAFDDLINLKVLKIDNNRDLDQLPVNLFKNNLNLETLELPNLTEDLNWEMFKGLPHLTSLVVSLERLSSFNAEKIGQNIPNLRYFQIDKDINFIGNDAYNRFKEKLKKLNVTIVTQFQ